MLSGESGIDTVSGRAVIRFVVVGGVVVVVGMEVAGVVGTDGVAVAAGIGIGVSVGVAVSAEIEIGVGVGKGPGTKSSCSAASGRFVLYILDNESTSGAMSITRGE